MKLAHWTIAAAFAGSLGCLPMQKKSEPMTPEKAKTVAVASDKKVAATPVNPAEEITEANRTDAANRFELEMQNEMKALDKK